MRDRDDNAEYLGFLRRAIRAAGRRVIAEDPSTLADLVQLQAQLDRVVAASARHLHDDAGFSWGEIGHELGIPRQDAWRKYHAA